MGIPWVGNAGSCRMVASYDCQLPDEMVACKASTVGLVAAGWEWCGLLCVFPAAIDPAGL